MHQIIKKIIFISALTFSTFASSVNLDKLFLDMNYWANFNWNDFEKSQIMLDDRLISKDKEDKSKSVIVGDIELNGLQFKEWVEKDNQSSRISKKIHLTLITEDETEEACERVSKTFEKAFGKNFEVTKYKSVVANLPFLSNSKKYYEWLNGKTNIQVDCFEIMRGKFYAQAIYAPNIEDNRVKKPIKLSCEHTYKLRGTNEINSATPLKITILQEEMDVTLDDDNWLGKVEELTYATIKISYKPKNAKVTMTINRFDGNLTGTFVDSKSDLILANYSGTCKKRITEKQKF